MLKASLLIKELGSSTGSRRPARKPSKEFIVAIWDSSSINHYLVFRVLVPRYLRSIAVLWGLFGRPCRVVKFLKTFEAAMRQNIRWDILLALSFTALNQFKCRGKFRGGE